MADKPEKAEVEQLQQQLEMYQLIFESISSGAMVTDAQGFITHFNRYYGQFLGLDPEAQIGRHCTEAVENTRMHLVAQSGKPEFNSSQLINGQKMVVQRIPIRKDGKVIAVFGQVMFKDVRDVGKLARELSLLESKLKLYEEELISLRATRYTFESILGESEEIHDLKREALKACGNTFPVLITGESGTGKELFAQAIHNASYRRCTRSSASTAAPYPATCSPGLAIRLRKRGFTGANEGGKPGKFELADDGTIFLDEIDSMPLEMQTRSSCARWRTRSSNGSGEPGWCGRISA